MFLNLWTIFPEPSNDKKTHHRQKPANPDKNDEKFGADLLSHNSIIAKLIDINAWPLNFLRTGFYRRAYGSLSAPVTGGYWWASTAGSATYGRYLDTGTGYVDAQRNGYRGYGFALRCVAR